MIKIRPEQAATLADEDMIRRTEAWLRTRHPDKVAAMEPEDLRAVIVHGFETARSYGFESERALFTFVMDQLAVGPCFDEQPEIKEILERDELSEDERLDRIVSDVGDEAWTAAGEITDPVRYWDEVIAAARAARR